MSVSDQSTSGISLSLPARHEWGGNPREGRSPSGLLSPSPLLRCVAEREQCFGMLMPSVPTGVRGWVAFSVALLAFVFGIEAAEPFLARTYTNQAGATLPYRLLTPSNYDAARSYPAILYLHGAAGRGADNEKPLEWGPRLIAEELKRGKHEFFLVVPQCPRSEGWSNITPGEQPLPGKSLLLALELLTNSLPKEFNLDPARRYLTGVSMGGHATWSLLCRDTGLFAAAVPVCAGGDARRVTDRVAKVPVWVFHSDDDHLVPVQQARDFVKAWRAHGGEVRYTEYTGVKHSSWKKAYVEPAMYDWLFEKRAGK